MNKLPQELVEKIAQHLIPGDYREHRLRNPRGRYLWNPAAPLAPFACLSRAWQRVIEPWVFYSLRIDDTDLEDMACILGRGSGARLSMLRDLQVQILLPAYHPSAQGEHVTDDEEEAHNRFASKRIALLLQILSGVSHLPRRGHGLSLCIIINSPSDASREQRPISHHDAYNGRGDDRPRSYLPYVSLSDFCHMVPYVEYFDYEGYRALTPGGLVRLTRAFPSLRRVDWFYQEPAFFMRHRLENIQQFINVLAQYRLSPTTDHLTIWIDSPDYPSNQEVPDIVSMLPRGSRTLCYEIRRLIGASRALQCIQYTGPVEPLLFWSEDDLTQDQGGWSSMRDLHFVFNLASPTGQWYFRCPEYEQTSDDESSDEAPSTDFPELAPPGYGSVEDTKAAVDLIQTMNRNTIPHPRRLPRDETILPLLEAFSRRLTTMPSLASAFLKSSHMWHDWSIQYKAPGEPFELPGKEASYRLDASIDESLDLERARLYLDCHGWRPSEAVLDLFRSVGRVHHGKDTLIVSAS